MYSRTESFFSGYQDVQLYYQRWTPKNIKGQLIITHGHGEHSESYQRVVDGLADSGWSIIAWDWRGHGRSQGQRGYADQFNDYCYDFEAFINFLQHNQILQPELPLVLLGHSMGGLIQLRSLLNHPEWKFSAQVLSSPMLGVALEVPAIKQFAGQLLRNILPRLTLSSGIISTQLTGDPEIVREFEHDVLRHDKISSGVWFGALECITYVQERAAKFQKPLLLQMPEQDPVVSSEAGLKFFEALTCEKVLKVYAQAKHEIYNDLGRKAALADLRQYLTPSRFHV